jgi:hypothetical protein
MRGLLIVLVVLSFVVLSADGLAQCRTCPGNVCPTLAPPLPGYNVPPPKVIRVERSVIVNSPCVSGSCVTDAYQAPVRRYWLRPWRWFR